MKKMQYCLLESVGNCSVKAEGTDFIAAIHSDWGGIS